MKVPDGIQGLSAALLAGLHDILGDKLFGVYVYGAVAFSDTLPTGDLDFHVILKERLTARQKTELNELYTKLAQEFPPLGVGLDGYYLLLHEARGTAPPQHQLVAGLYDNSWALHREHIRAGRCIVLHGPDPREIYPAASWPELEQALFGELRYVEDHLDEYADYCILNLCRLMYSFGTRDVVVSKAQAAAWAWDAFPQWRQQIELARKSYAGQATVQDRESMLAEVGGFYRFACRQIQESQNNPGARLAPWRAGEKASP